MKQIIILNVILLVANLNAQRFYDVYGDEAVFLYQTQDSLFMISEMKKSYTNVNYYVRVSNKRNKTPPQEIDIRTPYTALLKSLDSNYSREQRDSVIQVTPSYDFKPDGVWLNYFQMNENQDLELDYMYKVENGRYNGFYYTFKNNIISGLKMYKNGFPVGVSYYFSENRLALKFFKDSLQFSDYYIVVDYKSNTVTFKNEKENSKLLFQLDKLKGVIKIEEE